MAKVMEQSAYKDDTLPVENLDKSNKNSATESSDEDAPRKNKKKHVQKLSDSDTDEEKHETENKIVQPLSDSDSDSSILTKSVPRRSRIKLNNESESDECHHEIATKNEEQQSRLKNKKNKLKEKFKGLISSRDKEEVNEDKSDSNDNESIDPEEDISSIENIKKKIQERMSTFKSSVCDPDTSDEESQHQQQIPKQKKERKRAKQISPKPQRMSAKQAMENMHKIKSESNRMLREKEVSLPYHRPKALSLKDIMSRRQTALAADGKTLPIKMNEKQLQQYAQMLEERQKKMMELWQSESDEDDDGKDDNETTGSDLNKDTVTNENHELNMTDKDPQFNTDIDINPQENEKPCEKTEENTETHLNSSTILNVANELPQAIDETNLDPNSEEQDSETNLTLRYNESETSITENKSNENIEEAIIQGNSVDNHAVITENINQIDNNLPATENKETEMITHEINTENRDTQAMHLYFDSEPVNELENVEKSLKNISKNSAGGDERVDGGESSKIVLENEENKEKDGRMDVDDFSDTDLNMDDIDNMIENAEIIRDIEDKLNTPVLMRDIPLNVKPKLTGAPGMVIDLEDKDPGTPKLSGVELLKERFKFFAKLKTPEEMERERENKIKPGTLHLKLKHDLEEQIAEQRSLEWAKRLEEEKQQQKEHKALRGEESDDENDLDKIEAKLEEINDHENNIESNGEECEEEEEPIEDDCDMNDKPRVKSAMFDDEAEESDCDDIDENGDDEGGVENTDIPEDDHDDKDQDDVSESEESESSESEEEEETKTKKGRILKAFEDSDDEESTNKLIDDNDKESEIVNEEVSETVNVKPTIEILPISQDEELQLAQRQSVSDDLFTSQESSLAPSQTIDKTKEIVCSGDIDLGTQTFSILDSTKPSNLGTQDLISIEGTQTPNEGILQSELGDFTQNALPVQIPTQVSQSQPIGDDVLALCTGKFYDNEFVSQSDINKAPASQDDDFDYNSQLSIGNSQESQRTLTTDINEVVHSEEENKIESDLKGPTKIVDDNLKSILDELDDPEFDSPKPNKFFVGGKKKELGSDQSVLTKKRLVIDSDDEDNENVSEQKKRKKLKKKKPEKRALQFSDDEDEEIQEEEEYYESNVENEEDPERLVEYDSEENEIEIRSDNPKKKRKATDFFEQEAELTSEDEWVGSGDENEAGLDRMEREAGDDEVFHQGQLQRELGQIHMRDVLDQDKREVRMIQELLFEDGDLGGGGRQRKFRWKNLDGDDETGPLAQELIESQEDQESEEQWRKQRHEREMFLRQLQSKEEEENLNISVNRTTIIKANLSSKTMSSLLLEVNSKTEKAESSVLIEKKTAKDIPSPKKPFALLQQNYQGSLLNRGSGALARLAALATPLAVDDDAPKTGVIGPSSRRNFVFAAISQDDQPKATKRKAAENPNTPKLIKKMKRDEKKNTSKNSLLDHIKI